MKLFGTRTAADWPVVTWRTWLDTPGDSAERSVTKVIVSIVAIIALIGFIAKGCSHMGPPYTNGATPFYDIALGFIIAVPLIAWVNLAAFSHRAYEEVRMWVSDDGEFIRHSTTRSRRFMPWRRKTYGADAVPWKEVTGFAVEGAEAWLHDPTSRAAQARVAAELKLPSIPSTAVLMNLANGTVIPLSVNTESRLNNSRLHAFLTATFVTDRKRKPEKVAVRLRDDLPSSL